MLFKFIFSYHRRTPFKILFGFFMLILVDVAQLISPRLIQKAIDLIVSNVHDASKLMMFSGLILLLALGIGIFRFTWRMIIIGTSHFIEMDFKNRLYDHLLSLDSAFFNKTKTGDIMAHMTNDMQAVRMSTAFGLISGFDAIFLFSAALIFMLKLNWQLTLFAMIPLPVISFITLFAMKLMFTKFKNVQESFSTLTDKVQEMISGMKIIQAYNQEDSERENFNVISKDYVNKNISLVKLWGTMFPLIFLLADMGIAIVLFVGGQFVILNKISPGTFVAFFAYLGIITWPMMAMGWSANIFQRGNASYKRILKFMEAQAEIKDSESAASIPVKGSIRFEGVNFSYDGNPVLKNISLDINRGEYIGIVGKIGSGKTTVAKLILRIISPDSGNIFFDDVYYCKIKIDSIRESVGYVPQDSFLFSQTIMENIRFGRRDATDEEIMNVCKIAAVDKDILELKDGYSTLIGERGVTLSGGQKQRLCIARALIRKPRILILDDALSAVDTNTEKLILKNLSEFSKDITAIVISHRISSFINADKIYVLDSGSVESSGKHEELIYKSPVYSEIYRIQKLDE